MVSSEAVESVRARGATGPCREQSGQFAERGPSQAGAPSPTEGNALCSCPHRPSPSPDPQGGYFSFGNDSSCRQTLET